MRKVLLAVVLVGLAGGPRSAAWDGVSPLAGEWAGLRTIHEKGGCRLDGAAKARRPVTLTVRIAPNGAPLGELAFADAPGEAPLAWRGSVDGARLEFEAAQAMTCRGTTHRYVVRPTGTMPARAGRGSRLRLTAADGLCGCGFDVRYDLTWVSPAPPRR